MSDNNELDDHTGQEQIHKWALVIFHKLSQELKNMDDDPDEKEARRAIREAIELIPDLHIKSTETPSIVYLKHPGKNKEIRFPLQDAIDSLLILWNEYRRNQTS